MVGGGPFQLNPGEWTDDTSMALCLGQSLRERGRFDPRDVMDKFVAWWSEGYMSHNDQCFDIGSTTSHALAKYRHTGNPYAGNPSEHASGNGGIMRLAPVVIWYRDSPDVCMTMAEDSSRLTHCSQACLVAARALATAILHAFLGDTKEEMLKSFRSDTRGQGTGYVVDALQSAVMCFRETDNFEDAILMATNLGNDADTTAAITGQLAGAYYGVQGIPEAWLERLAWRDRIDEMAIALWWKL
jgi:ADP-ribosyl-[dinitrogen reductase] hydrolase